MNCPHCKNYDTGVLDSRLTERLRINGVGKSVRRRRTCHNCGHRFTTYENHESELNDTAAIQELIAEMTNLKKRIMELWR